MEEQVYIVIGEAYYYEERVLWPVAAFSSKEEAQAFAVLCFNTWVEAGMPRARRNPEDPLWEKLEPAEARRPGGAGEWDDSFMEQERAWRHPYDEGFNVNFDCHKGLLWRVWAVDKKS